MNSAAPAISVLLPVYNGGRYLGGAIESLLAQTFGDFEVIAVDDGSTDRSLDVLTAYANRDPRIRVISRTNTGIVGALNEALRVARAPLVARMDADDIALPGRLFAQKEFMDRNPEILGCGTAVYVMDTRNAIVDLMRRPLHAIDIERALLRGDGGALIHPSTLFRAEAVARVGGYRLEAQFTEDLDLYLRLAEHGPLANLPEPLLCYRIHFSSVNFVKVKTKAAVKRAVMMAAYERRGLPFDESSVNLRNFTKRRSEFHRDWAVKSLAFTSLQTPLWHALAACRDEPGNRASWRTLSYVLRQLGRRIKVRGAADRP